ncbi:hypothetical protein JTE90_024841 [Oedothorax gibbosus]|uniref:Uncharacterized protein n=1 Tax=Oedothorax gibbosus TaxID=931172 RepID=A0AAV6UB37_9ARAC|nr:hypothetical protein JTE90_024841 [Oedothorax gibbosus]
MSSDYFKKLDFLTSIRYEEKLKVGSIDLPDPLDIAVRDSVFSDDTRNWPDLTFGDIYLYLVESTCWYTKEQFKSFKLLDGYNLFSSGKIKKILTYCAPRKVACNIVATVEAGQTLKKFYSSWMRQTL